MSYSFLNEKEVACDLGVTPTLTNTPTNALGIEINVVVLIRSQMKENL